jgi:acetyl esterase/lipase
VDVVNAITPSNDYERTANIAYGSDARMKLDVYRPLAPARAADGGAVTLPVVVFFYGGNWDSGSKDDYRFVAQALAGRGIIAVLADYRLYPDVRYPDFLDDSAAAVAWTFREIGRFGGDSRRITVAGHSAGAYNAAMLAYDPSWLSRQGVDSSRLAGFVGLAGPYNFLPIEEPVARLVFDWPNTRADSQPIHYVSGRLPPTLLIVAVNDSVVSPERNTYPLAQRLTAVGATVEVKRYSSVSHATLIGAMSLPLRWLAPVLDDVAGFVLSHGNVQR